MKIGQLYFLVFFLLIPVSVFSFTGEELKHEEALTNIARSRCATEFIEGKDYKIKVLANGNIQVSLLGKKGGGLNGTFEYTREEWEGRQRVLREHQMSDNKDFRKCVREELDSLRKSYKPPKPVSENESVKIINVRCGNDRWVYIDIQITNSNMGILSYTLFPTWGGGGDISETFSAPLPKRIEKTLMFKQPSRDLYSRNHQFGLQAKFGFHGSVIKFAGPENTFEPNGRCPGT